MHAENMSLERKIAVPLGIIISKPVIKLFGIPTYFDILCEVKAAFFYPTNDLSKKYYFNIIKSSVCDLKLWKSPLTISKNEKGPSFVLLNWAL